MRKVLEVVCHFTARHYVYSLQIVIYITREIKPSFYYLCVPVEKI